MRHPGWRVDQYLVLKLYLELQVAPCVPCDDRTDGSGKKIDQYAGRPDDAVGKEMGQYIDADMAIVTTRRDRPDHGQPENHELEQFIRPDEAGLEQLTQYDLSEAQDDHAAQHHNKRNILELLPQSIEAGE